MTNLLTHRPKDKPSANSMNLSQHLGELRHRLVICAIALAMTTLVAVIAYEPILHFLIRPLCDVDAVGAHSQVGTSRSLITSSGSTCNLFVTSPLDGLALRVKIAMFGGLVLASPVILFQLWRFITPGLNPKEKKYAVPFIVASIALFAVGCLVAYLTFPHALNFLNNIGGPSLQQIYNPNSYLGLILLLMTIFGLTFEFPVLLISLEIAGVLSPETLGKWRRWAIVAIVVVAGVVTPSSDPFSMLAMAVPLYLFYEISIVVGKVLNRRSTGDPVSELDSEIETPTGSS